MDILSALLGYPVSIFANVSTEYLTDKFRKTPQEQFRALFLDSFTQGIRSYYPKTTVEEGIQRVFLSAIEKNPQALISVISNLDYGALTVAELRTTGFKETFLKTFCTEYDLDYDDVKKIGKNILDSGFKAYELKFFSKATRTLADAVTISTLNKLYNDVAKKEDIDRLREVLIKSIESEASKEDEVVGWFLGEISSIETNDISNPIKYRMKQFDKVVEKLTEDQMRVLQHQKYHKRLLIKGCAGSGKTIIAAERAIRLSKAGFRVLITCFNPHLSVYIRSLVSGESVDVLSFSQLIQQLAGISNLSHDWNIYTEPGESEIDAAFDCIARHNTYYDAILVDEGQDFKDHWWEIIMALLDNSNEGMLYIFADDKQNFHRINAKYPISDSPFYLSRNVRNAGKIFELIRQFHAAAPPPSAFLEGFGITKIGIFDSSRIVKTLIGAINDASELVDLKDLAILSLTHEIDSAIRNQLKGNSFSLASAIEQKINTQLDEMSRKFLGKHVGFEVSVPIETWHKAKIKNLLKECKKNLPSNYQDNMPGFYWKKQVVKVSDDVERMEYNLYERSSIGSKRGSTSTAKLVAHHVNLYTYYNSPGWDKALPDIPVLSFNGSNFQIGKTNDSIPLLTVSDYKGLEAKAIILVVDRPVQDLETFLYVGISRAVYYLSILIDPRAAQYIQNTGRNLN